MRLLNFRRRKLDLKHMTTDQNIASHTKPSRLAQRVVIRPLPLEANGLWLRELGPEDRVIVAEDRRRLCALAALKLFRDRGFSTAWVGLFVMSSYRNRGIGRCLLEALLELADQELALDCTDLVVDVDNYPALHLYESLGFQQVTGVGTERLFEYSSATEVWMIRPRPTL
jgi:putative acetyltransferase